MVFLDLAEIFAVVSSLIICTGLVEQALHLGDALGSERRNIALYQEATEHYLLHDQQQSPQAHWQKLSG